MPKSALSASAPSSSDDEEDDAEDLSMGELQRRKETRELRRLLRAFEDACVSVVLNDKGTRLGAELWRGGGVIVSTPHCVVPCLLTTAATVPDAYHAAHASVYFRSNGGAAPVRVRLSPETLLVVASGGADDLIDDFPPEEVPLVSGTNYSLVALAEAVPSLVQPIALREGPPFLVLGDPIRAVQPPEESEASELVRSLRGRIRKLGDISMEFAPDPTADGTLRSGAAVFLQRGDGLLDLVSIHAGHSADVEGHKARSEEDSKESCLENLSHGSWLHRCYLTAPIARHLRHAVVVLASRQQVVEKKKAQFIGSTNPRRDRVEVSLEILHGILHDPSVPPPELFDAEDAALLSFQAQGHGHTAVLTLLRLYRDEAVQRFSLEALARLMTDGRVVSVAAVSDDGGCELATLALELYAHNPDLVAAASWVITLLADRAEASRRLLRCEASTALVRALRLTSEMGAFHREAQRWGLSAFAVLARNGSHRECLFVEGACSLIPGLLSNHPDVIADLELQLWGLNCVLEMASGSVDTAGEALLDAGAHLFPFLLFFLLCLPSF